MVGGSAVGEVNKLLGAALTFASAHTHLIVTDGAILRQRKGCQQAGGLGDVLNRMGPQISPMGATEEAGSLPLLCGNLRVLRPALLPLSFSLLTGGESVLESKIPLDVPGQMLVNLRVSRHRLSAPVGRVPADVVP